MLNAVLSEPGTVGVRAADQRVAMLRQSLNRALRGKSQVVERVLACVLAGGHLLIEDLPGLGKTTLAKAVANSIGGRFQRVQCTPDLLPGDITGFNLFNQKTREFEFLPGPVFADVLLVDEINRATPRTQSALLEAMAEKQVTIDVQRHRLSESFFVIATQNPGDHHGTYPLPEAQLDRFSMRVAIGYPDAADEIQMLADAAEVDTFARRAGHESPPVMDLADLADLHTRVRAVAVAPQVRDYLVRIAAATRRHPRITLGISPRGLLILQRVAQAQAFLSGRTFVTPDDIHEIAGPVLSVRLAVNERTTANRLIEEVLSAVPVPTRA